MKRQDLERNSLRKVHSSPGYLPRGSFTVYLVKVWTNFYFSYWATFSAHFSLRYSIILNILYMEGRKYYVPQCGDLTCLLLTQMGYEYSPILYCFGTINSFILFLPWRLFIGNNQSQQKLLNMSTKRVH